MVYLPIWGVQSVRTNLRVNDIKWSETDTGARPGCARLRLKEGMNVLNKKDASTAQKLFQQMRSTSTAELPAVELHMFPDEPSNVESCPHLTLISG